METARRAVLRQQEFPSVILLGVLSAACVACDFFMIPLLAMVPRRPILGFPLLMASVGCVLAQVCLLAAWLAWSDRPFGQRLLRHWIIAAILYLVWAAGLALGLPSRFILASSMVGLSLPLVSIAVQLPLWLARLVFGWRLIRVKAKVSDGDANRYSGAEPLTIRGLMLATVLVALALAPARWVPSPDGKEMVTPGFIIFLAATTISAIALLPASPLLLRTPRLRHGVLFAALYAAFWVALLWGGVLIARNRGLLAPPPMAVPLGLSCLILSFAATVILAATAARTRGYRLTSGRQSSRGGSFSSESSESHAAATVPEP